MKTETIQQTRLRLSAAIQLIETIQPKKELTGELIEDAWYLTSLNIARFRLKACREMLSYIYLLMGKPNDSDIADLSNQSNQGIIFVNPNGSLWLSKNTKSKIQYLLDDIEAFYNIFLSEVNYDGDIRIYSTLGKINVVMSQAKEDLIDEMLEFSRPKEKDIQSLKSNQNESK